MKSAVTATLARGVSPVLAASAILVIMAPTAQTWIVVMAISVAAGAGSAWSAYQRYKLFADLLRRVDECAMTARTALTETAASRIEANNLLVKSFERSFGEYEQRDEQSRSNALTKLTKDVTALVAEYREFHDSKAESRAAATVAELAKVRETLSAVGRGIETSVNDWRKTTEEVQRVSQRFADAITAQQQHLDEQRAMDEKSRRALLADWESVAQKSTDSIRDLATDVGARLEELLVSEKKEQEKQKQAERDHFEAMLEDQRRAHEAAAERSGQLWGHLLDQLNK